MKKDRRRKDMSNIIVGIDGNKKVIPLTGAVVGETPAAVPAGLVPIAFNENTNKWVFLTVGPDGDLNVREGKEDTDDDSILGGDVKPIGIALNYVWDPVGEVWVRMTQP